MTKKDYEAIAAIFAKIDLTEAPASQWDDGHDCAIRATIFELCTVFQNDNPRFDRERFLQACGIE